MQIQTRVLPQCESNIRYYGEKAAKCPLGAIDSEKVVKPKAKCKIFNKKITFLLKPNFFCITCFVFIHLEDAEEGKPY